jgi:hypothetical protein
MIQARVSAASTDGSASKPVTGAAFWALMARWDVPDAQALQLIGQPPSASGKRPRFALNPDQVERLGYFARSIAMPRTSIRTPLVGFSA